jgi:hypothetical protein
MPEKITLPLSWEADAAYDEALTRVRRYLEMRDARPLTGIGDCVHVIHGGTEWEGELRLSDLRLVVGRAGR